MPPARASLRRPGAGSSAPCISHRDAVDRRIGKDRRAREHCGLPVDLAGRAELHHPALSRAPRCDRRAAAPRWVRWWRRPRCIGGRHSNFGNSSRSSSRSLKSRLASGSSSSTRSASLTRARASAVRCCWPPESSDGLRLSIGVSRSRSETSVTRFRTSASATPGDAQRRGDVLEDVEIGVVDELLVDHRDVALLHRDAGDVLAAEPDLAGGRPLEPGHQLHQRRLAGERGAEQNIEAVVGERSGRSERCGPRCRRAWSRCAVRSTYRSNLPEIWSC